MCNFFCTEIDRLQVALPPIRRESIFAFVLKSLEVWNSTGFEFLIFSNNYTLCNRIKDTWIALSLVALCRYKPMLSYHHGV